MEHCKQKATVDTTQIQTISSEKSMIFDARGNGQGGVSPTITGDHQNRITDYTAIVVERRVYDPSRRHNYECFGDTCCTLDSHMGTGGATYQ